MEEKQLDFNAPILSVRRHAAVEAAAAASASCSYSFGSALRASGSGERLDAARVKNFSLQVYKTDLQSGPVRDPGVVPFVWEQIPGRPKDALVVSPNSSEPPAPAPRLPPGKVVAKRENVKTVQDEDPSLSGGRLPPGKMVDPRRESMKSVEDVGREVCKVGRSQNDCIVQSKWPVGGVRSSGRVSLPNSIAESHGSSGSKKKEKLDEDDCDAFSDALETFSLAESSLFNGSISCVSALDGPASTMTGISGDLRERSFMMDRFLPAAKAMASEAPKYASRKQPLTNEPAKLVNSVRRDREPSRSQPKPYFNQEHGLAYEEEDDEEEEEEEEDDDDDAGNFLARACGAFPWNWKNSLCLTNPMFRAERTRNKKKTPSSFVARKGNVAARSNYSGCFSGSDEMTWEAVYRSRFIGKVQGFGLHGGGSKLNDSCSSSVYEDTANNQLTCWSDSQKQDGSPSFRRPPSGVSPYRNEASNSPCGGSGFLGIPQSCKSFGSDNSDMNIKRPEARKDTSHCRSERTSDSMSPTILKTEYVDFVCVGDASNPKSEDTEVKELIQPITKESTTPGEHQQKQGKLTLNSCVISQQSELDTSDDRNIRNDMDAKPVKAHSCLRTDIGLLSCAETSDNNSRDHVASVINLVQGSDTGDQAYKLPMSLKEGMPIGRKIDCVDVSSKSEYSRGQNSGNHSEADAEGNCHSLPPLPSPKSPSESWLFRALPAVSAQNSSSLLFLQYHWKKSAIKAPVEPKWETIIKSTNVDHGHLRYSEELAQSVPRQTEN